MARRFTSASTERITFSVGTIPRPVTNGVTVVAILNRVTASDTAYPFRVYTATNNTLAALRLNDSSQLTALISNETTKSPSTAITMATNTWVLVAVTKSTGTGLTRFHYYRYSTDAWTRFDTSSTASTSDPGAAANVSIGTYASTLSPFDGHIAAVGYYGRQLSDAELDSMPFTLSAWTSTDPAALWVFDQSDVGQDVPDLTGGGANQLARTGSTVSPSSVPVFSYGHILPRVSVSETRDPATPLYVAGATMSVSAGTGSILIPPEAQAGQVAVMTADWKMATGTATLATPSGWTQVIAPTDNAGGSGSQCAAWIYEVQSGDPGSTVTVNSGGSSQQLTAVLAVYSGASPTPSDAGVTVNSSTASTAVDTAAETVAANDRVILFGGVRASSSGPQPTFVAPAGYAVRKQTSATSGGAENVASFLADGTASGTQQVTASTAVWSVAGQIVLSPPSSGVTGVLDGVLPALVGAAAGVVAVHGGVAGTLPALLGVFEGGTGVPVTGGLAADLPALTGAATATVAVAGDVAGVLPALTAAAAGTVAAHGVLAGVLPTLTATLAAEVAVRGGLDGALPTLTAAAAGVVAVHGALGGALPALVGALDGETAARGSINTALPALGAAVTAITTSRGTINTALPALGGVFVSDVAAPGVLNAALPAFTATFTAAVAAHATIDAALPALTGAVTGGTAARGALDTALPALTGAITAAALTGGVIDTALPALTGTVAGTVTAHGALGGVLPVLVGAFTAGSRNNAQLNATLPPIGAVAAGAVTVAGPIATFLPALTAVFAGSGGPAIPNTPGRTITGSRTPRNHASGRTARNRAAANQ